MSRVSRKVTKTGRRCTGQSGGGGESNSEMRAEDQRHLEKSLCPLPPHKPPPQPQRPRSSPQLFSPTRRENFKKKKPTLTSKLHRFGSYCQQPASLDQQPPPSPLRGTLRSPLSCLSSLPPAASLSLGRLSCTEHAGLSFSVSLTASGL